jgi:hypothetical protein
MLRTLGIEEESVRQRVSRGNMRFEKAEDGRLYVYVDGTKLTGKGYVGKLEAPRATHRETTHGAAEGVWQGETSWTW